MKEKEIISRKSLKLFLDIVSSSLADNVTKRVTVMFSWGKTAWAHIRSQDWLILDPLGINF